MLKVIVALDPMAGFHDSKITTIPDVLPEICVLLKKVRPKPLAVNC
jgi:hypothetical protein